MLRVLLDQHLPSKSMASLSPRGRSGSTTSALSSSAASRRSALSVLVQKRRVDLCHTSIPVGWSSKSGA
jgi:hypothetical protein